MPDCEVDGCTERAMSYYLKVNGIKVLVMTCQEHRKILEES